MGMLDWLTPDVVVLIAFHGMVGALAYMVFWQMK